MSDAPDHRSRDPSLDEVVALCKRRGFIFPSSEIYGGVGSTYDYGHYGVLLKNNVKAEWWRAMLQDRDDIVAIDSAIIQHPRVWEASGHLAGLHRPDGRLQDLQAALSRRPPRGPRAAARKPSKRPGEGPDCELTEAREFNLMFETTVGPVKDSGSTAYLRPETAQGIFINFKNVLQFARKKPPFGIAQIGKSFRNEITPGNFIFRTREFEQMEMEFFCPPDEAEQLARALDGRADALVHRARDPARQPDPARARAPTSSRTTRARPPTSSTCSRWGSRSSRGSPTAATSTSRQHAEFSGEKLEYFDQQTKERYVPHVIEPAAGVDRAMLAFLVDAYDVEEVEGRQRTVLRLHPKLAPVKVAVLPLVSKDGMPERAREIFDSLRHRIPAEYDEGGSIGKRYRRQDEIGTPWGVTVDGQTAEDDTVTLRDRDSLEQTRVPVDGLADALEVRLDRALAEPEARLDLEA